MVPLPYRSESEYRRLKGQYEGLCHRAGFRADLSPEWTLDGPVGGELAAGNPTAAAGVLAAQDKLIDRYNWWDGPDHRAGLAVIALKTALQSLGQRSYAMSAGPDGPKHRLLRKWRVRSPGGPDPAPHPGNTARVGPVQLVRPGTARGGRWP